MIFQPAALALLLAASLNGLLLAGSGMFAVRLLRHWNPASGSERQIALERRTHLVSTLVGLSLVISLPASDTSGSPHAQANDVEVGGERGRAALDRLRNAVGRVARSTKPGSEPVVASASAYRPWSRYAVPIWVL